MYMYMLMDYTIYLNNVCLNLQNVPCGRVCILIQMCSQKQQCIVTGRGRVDITDRLFLNPEVLVSEATRNGLTD